MSGQINLYHPRYLRKREWLTLTNLAMVVIGLAALLAFAGGMAWRGASARQAEALAAESQLKAVKDQVEAQTQAAANRKPSQQLLAEISDAETILARREHIVRLLAGGSVGNTSGFSEFLRGLARQVPEGLWLTGFTIGSGGADLEIRGRMLNGTALPDYIRRLGGEKAFHGRSFSALTLNRPDAQPATAVAAVAAGSAGPPSAQAPRYVEFVLTPTVDGGGKP